MLGWKRLRMIGVFFKIVAYQFRALIHFLYGVWRISQLPYAPVTIFGGAKLKNGNIYMQKAMDLSYMLASGGMPVLTGGGPGIMEAATCGAVKTKGIITTIGITVQGLETIENRSKCNQRVITMDNFAARKWLLINYSIGFIVFPGGFGTLNELTELLTLIQTNKRQKAPIVLIGSEYWGPLMVWIMDSALKEGLILKEDAELFSITDDLDEVYSLMKKVSKNERFTV